MTAEIKIKNLYLEQSSSQLRKDAPEFIPGCGVVGALIFRRCKMEIGKKQQIVEGDFNITLESEEFEESPEYWQKQYNLLYNMMIKELPSGSIQPLSYKSAEGEKADLVTIFSTLVATGIAVEAFDKLFDIIKIWLENRPKTKVTLKYQDGSIIELSGLSKSKALALMEEHHSKITIRE